MIGIIIQARTGSTRLPQKMTLPFYNEKGILETILIRLKMANLNIPIVLATTENLKDNQIENIGKVQGITVFRGSESNVLDRFIKAAEATKLSKIIRICADNPFLDIEALKNQIHSFRESNSDYWCYCKKDKTPTIKTHYGFWTEGVTLNALKKIANNTSENLFKEHVTNYIYTHSNDFKIHFEPIHFSVDKENDIRLTIDTSNDFETAKEIYSKLIKRGIPFNATHIVKFINTNPEWIRSMKKEINTNSK